MVKVKGENNKHVELPANEAHSSSTSHTDPLLIRMEEYIDRHNFGYYLKQLGAPQVRIRNRASSGWRCAKRRDYGR